MRRAGVLSIVVVAAVGACAQRTITEKERNTARIHYDLAIASFNEGDMRGALRELLAAAENDPELPQVHDALGLVYHSMGHLDDALEHYKTAIRLKPSFSEAYNNMGILLIDLGRYDEAIAAFRKALSDILYATPSVAEGNLGWAYYRGGDVQQGLKHLRNAVAMSPKFCRGYEWLMRIGLDRDEGDQVVQSCERLHKHCVDDPEVAQTIDVEQLRQMQFYCALGYLKKDEREKAKTYLASCAKAQSEALSADCQRTLGGLE